VAREVLEVADHVENPELARRLIEAIVLLPDVSAIRPVPGAKYEPVLHEWAGHRITDEKTQWDTIAETLAPGAITAQQSLLRPAHVIVFEPPEES
jgi:molecular chaperone GrpE (heat shock protein)